MVYSIENAEVKLAIFTPPNLSKKGYEIQWNDYAKIDIIVHAPQTPVSLPRQNFFEQREYRD
jgi:hypothetical protein